MRLFIDMDGTLAKWNVVEYEEQLLKQGYYRNLEPNQKLVNEINTYINQGKDVYVLSCVLPQSKYAENEKKQWLKQYLPNLKDEQQIFVPYGKNKAEYLRENYSPITNKDFLLDDYTKNLLEWKTNGGIGIKYLNGINHTHGTWNGFCITEKYSKYIDDDALYLGYLQNIISGEIRDCSILGNCADFYEISSALSYDILDDMEYTLWLYEITDAINDDGTISDEEKYEFLNTDCRINPLYLSWYEGSTTTKDLIMELNLNKEIGEQEKSENDYEQPSVERASANTLPRGWMWVKYDDGSGSLQSPEGKKYCSYDWSTGEYKMTNDSIGFFLDENYNTGGYSVGSFKEFQKYAENYVTEMFLKKKENKEELDISEDY